ncbi:MAG TPA: heme-binding domain-containing protein [Vicinamibacterales bacterium]|jgi:mono/diheme cytochrome c family protein|nr:heme-binding domain-containing protein [Vicinamibacterales bacterium]
MFRLTRRTWSRIGMAAVGVFAAIQFVPYGRQHTNPAARDEPAWDSPETRALAERACYDCHSNETKWPIYSNVAPVSWLVQHDVDEGRSKLNLSEWTRPQKDADESAREVRRGDMPMAIYVLMHPGARLDAAERARLADGLAKTLGDRDLKASHAR